MFPLRLSRIVELIWDHSQFACGEFYREGSKDHSLEAHRIFQILAQREIERTQVRHKRFAQANYSAGLSDAALEERAMTPGSFENYKELSKNRKRIEERSWDIRALRQFANCFSSLKRITISHAAHGWAYEPLYETPLIRSLRGKLDYGILRSDRPYDLNPMGNEILVSWGENRAYHERVSRGYKAIFEMMANLHLPAQELVIETNGLLAGIPLEMFADRTQDYRNFYALLCRPDFHRLDLALLTGDCPTEGHNATQWGILGRPHLRSALERGTSLTHFSFSADVRPRDLLGYEDLIANDESWVPIQQILPVGSWPEMQHFGLSRFPVKQAELVDLLSNLPESVRSIELGFLAFVLADETYAGLIDAVRYHIRWRNRPAALRPRLVILLPISFSAPMGMANRVDSEIQEFLYHGGANPFRGSRGPNDVDFGVATELDVFNPGFKAAHTPDFDWKEEVQGMVSREDEFSRAAWNAMRDLRHASARLLSEVSDEEGASGEEITDEDIFVRELPRHYRRRDLEF
ncbi:hypothetical protein V2G26_019482 [Clonostachys chloroleuca]